MERTLAGGNDASSLTPDLLRMRQASSGLGDLARIDQYRQQGWLDDPDAQLPILDQWEKMLLSDAGIKDRAEFDALFARSKDLFAGNTGGIASDEWRRLTAQGYLNDPETRRIIDLFGGPDMRQTLGLEKMQAGLNPEGLPPPIPYTSVPEDYRDNEFINPDYQPPRPDLMAGIEQLPNGQYWRSEGPGDIPSSGNMVPASEFASLQQQMAAPPPVPSASMLNLQSFADIPGMAGRSSGDLIGINPGFTDPAVQQAYTGFTGNVPGAGRTLLDLFNANPTAYSRFQQALV